MIIPIEAKGERLDKYLSGVLSALSRGRIQEALEQGEILVNGEQVAQKYKLKGGESIELTLREAPVLEDLPEDLPLTIVYEDASILVLNKQAGLTVHPGAGQRSGTLVNALLHHRPELAVLPRAGIVHRLDKETTGLMVIAKTEKARLQLIEDLKSHAVERVYIALIQGELLSGLSIDAPIGRHPIDRKKMAVLPHSPVAKEAKTHVRILEKFKGFTLVEARLETGRTHQIRVHLAHLGYPLVGDRTYGRTFNYSNAIALEVREAVKAFPRQALQAKKISFIHPETAEEKLFEIKAECDIAELLEVLYNNRA